MENNFEAKMEISDETPISEIEPIEESGMYVESREDLKRFVEPPLLEACQELFDKGITTIFSSANKKDIGYNGHIAIDFDSLSSANKEIALKLGKEGIIHGSIPKKGIYLEFPINQDSTMGDIKKTVLNLAGKFEDQNS